MEHYDIYVNPEPQEFCLAFTDKWVVVGGHEIIIDKYRFSAVPIKNYFRISEVTSGAKVIDLPVPDFVQSYEDTMYYLESVVATQLVLIINKAKEKDPNKVEREIERMKNEAFKRLGEMPETNPINLDLLKADYSDVVH